MIKPHVLSPGDCVAVLSPSWGGPSIFPDVYENGIRFLEREFGLKVKEYPTARMDADRLYAHPELRAADINAAFADPEVRAVISTIGGDDSIRILPYLDTAVIMANPKLLMGYSDTTTLLCYLNMHGLVTCYGNSIMAGFSYLENFPDSCAEYRRILFEGRGYTLEPFAGWVDSYEPWGDKKNVGRVGPVNEEDRGHRWLHKASACSAPLWGGCIEVLAMMNGTLAWPAQDFWKGRALMIETSEDKPSPTQVGYILRNFGMQGLFNSLSALLIAKPKGYTRDEKIELDTEVLKIVVGEFGARNMNIVSNIEFGHTDPRHVMPLGVPLAIDPERELMQFEEPLFGV